MDLNQLLNEAAQAKDWIVLGGALLCLVVPIVLKALGKSVPIVDSIIDIAKNVLVAIRKKPEQKQVESKNDAEQGIASIVSIETAKSENKNENK